MHLMKRMSLMIFQAQPKNWDDEIFLISFFWRGIGYLLVEFLNRFTVILDQMVGKVSSMMIIFWEEKDSIKQPSSWMIKIGRWGYYLIIELSLRCIVLWYHKRKKWSFIILKIWYKYWIQCYILCTSIFICAFDPLQSCKDCINALGLKAGSILAWSVWYMFNNVFIWLIL